ncbi:hypothetical protein [Streptomyces sp. NBC_00358]|uniref:hypothetical protein n=1 Tax=Streptomyces sp. NBC_00358 TaxID=2975725 RepID=UPI002E2671C1
MPAILAYAAYKKTPDWPSTPEQLRTCGLLWGIALAASALMFIQMNYCHMWRRENSDNAAIIICFSILRQLSELPRNAANILEIEDLFAKLAKEIADFASASPHFSTPSRRVDVERHTSAVRAELMRQSGELLSRGVTQVPAAVATIGTLLERLTQQRWLQLLDVEGADISTPEVVDDTDRRDSWIIVGGSAFAALGLGSASALGIPLTAAIPSALVFLLGPATLWGSSRLGLTPRSVLASTRASLTDATQDDSPSSPGTRPTSLGAQATHGLNRD